MPGYRMMMDGYPKPKSYAKDADDDLICPLCMEPLDETDRNFYPCTCDYQVCLWCLHYIRTTMGNKCPACRRDYDEATMKYKTSPRTPAGSRSASVKKKRDPTEKDASSHDDRSNSPSVASGAATGVKDVRVIQRNLVYVSGIPPRVAKKEILKQHEYFGQFGKIQHIVVSKLQGYSTQVTGVMYFAYVTYTRKSEANAAVHGIEGMLIDGKMLKASYGTTKYCPLFLKGSKCTSPDCYFLHQFGDERTIKDDSSSLKTSGASSPYFRPEPTPGGPKLKDDPLRKRIDTQAPFKMLNLMNAKVRTAEERDTLNGYGVPERDTTSWANIAAGLKNGGIKSAPAGQYVYRHPEELQLQYAVLGEGYSDGYAHAFDGYRSQRGDAEYQTGYLAHGDADHGINGAELDQHELLQHLFSSPLIVDLQRYNRSDHIVYAIDSPIQATSTNGHYGDQANGLAHEDESSTTMMCSRWVVADDTHADGASYTANRRKQLDYYKDANQLAPSIEGESAIAGGAASLGPKDMFPERAVVDEILYKLKRHSLMLDNLAKQYRCDTHRARACEDRSARESFDTTKEANSSAGAGSISSRDFDVTPPSSRDTDGRLDCATPNILGGALSPESQLEYEIRLREELAEHVIKLAEIQHERELQFARHLGQLYGF